MNFFLNQGIGHGNSGVEHAQFYRAACFDRLAQPYRLVYSELLPALQDHLQEWGQDSRTAINLYDYLLAPNPRAYLLNDDRSYQPYQYRQVVDFQDTVREVIESANGGYQIHRVKEKYFDQAQGIYIVADAAVSLANEQTQLSWTYQDQGGARLAQDFWLEGFQGRDYYFASFEQLVAFFLDQLAQAFGPARYFVDRGNFYDEALVQAKRQGRPLQLIEVVHADHLVADTEPNRPVWNNFYQYAFDHLADYDAIVLPTDRQAKRLVENLRHLDQPVAAKELKKIQALAVGGVTDWGRPKKSVHDPIRLVSASRLHSEKNVDQLIALLARLHQAGLAAELTIYGLGEQEQALKEQAAALGLANQVHFAGLSQQLTKDLAKADIFLSASYSEGFGLTYLEALSQGLPVVSYANEYGAKALLTEGINAALVPLDKERQSQVPALAAAVQRVLAHYQTLSAGAIASVRQYDLAKLAQRWQAFGEELNGSASVTVAD
ncbi:glycosyltransferase [Leuconostocaceae bacterium ESL0958]|nr:glycosyltransferase [Leuconostocaceae bacterium ESL0958]